MESQVPSVLSPYRDTALEYRKAGFFGPLPIPYREKHPVPTDYNKRVSKYPDLAKIEEWRNSGRKNICVRLAGVDEEHELMGVDVDDYWKGDKKKNGGDQLQRLENKLGPLPETWTSSARTDGISGIRYFRVPRGLAFRGKVDKDIEVIRKGHRYAMVWPSINPESGGTLYWWFPPGVKPDKPGKDAWDGKIPNAKEFPLLPDAWIDYLTNNRVLATDDEIIDVDSSVREIDDWATDTFHGDDESPPCERMRQKLNLHLKKLEGTATFHDLLTAAHWNIVRLAFEGHVGWCEAINEYEAAFCEAVAKRGGGTTDRDLPTLHKEIFRSRVQAMRKIKGESDKRVADGVAAVDPCCGRTGACRAIDAGTGTDGTGTNSNSLPPVGGDDSSRDGTSEPPGEFDDVPKGSVKPVSEYEQNDYGNAKHFYDYFSNVSNGPSMRWVKGMGWIIWHEGENPHWESDPDGDQIIRRMWQKIRDRQSAYVDACFGDYQQKAEDFIKGLNGVTETDVKIAKAIYEKWRKFSESNGNVRNSENAIKALRSIESVKKDINDLNNNPFLLGVANGVVELGRDHVELRKANINDFVTFNTNVPWEAPSNHSMNIWKDYLDTFLPDPELQKCVQVAMGYCIIGGNPEKKMIVLKGDPNTGKSTMINAIESALGEYSQSVGQSVFQNHKLNPVLAKALSKRVIVCSEFDEQDQLSASQVKKLTGDSDTVQAELKGSNETVEKVPDFVPILATNEVPGIKGADKALDNRLHVIPFEITPNTISVGASNIVIKTCKVAVLNWLIEGYIEYRQLGYLPLTQQMKDAKKKFVSELDEIATFADECVADQTSPQGYVSRKDMFDKFSIWWIENDFRGHEKPSKPKFTRRMKALGYQSRDTRYRVNGHLDHWWTGIKLMKSSPNVISINKNVEGGTKDGT